MAKLYGVSVGPGDFELMTLKAVSVLKKVNYIMVPRTKGDKTMAFDMSAAVIKGVENCGLDTQKIYESKEDLKYGCGYFTTLICKNGDKC